MPERNPAILSEPVGGARHLASGFIVLFLLIQLLVPLRCYLGGQTDERFCWRMFSSVVQRDCRVEVNETIQEGGRSFVRPVRVSSVLPTWSDFFHDYPVVVKQFMHWSCDLAGAQVVHYRCRCTRVDGSAAAPVEFTINCRTRRIRALEPAP
jgi:hypothetical protein